MTNILFAHDFRIEKLIDVSESSSQGIDAIRRGSQVFNNQVSSTRVRERRHVENLTVFPRNGARNYFRPRSKGEGAGVYYHEPRKSPRGFISGRAGATPSAR